MHLSVARLCLDCQEIHDADRCPICTSEAFGFMTRWVTIDPAPPRRASPHEQASGRSSKVDSYRQILNPSRDRSTAARWLRKGGLVVVAGYLARWGWQIAAQHNRSSERDSGKDKAIRQDGSR